MNTRKTIKICAIILLLILGGMLAMHIYKNTNSLFKDQKFAKLMSRVLNKDVRDITQEDLDNVSSLSFDFFDSRSIGGKQGIELDVSFLKPLDVTNITGTSSRINSYIKNWEDIDNFINIDRVFLSFEDNFDKVANLDSFPTFMELSITSNDYYNTDFVFEIPSKINVVALEMRNFNGINARDLNSKLVEFENLSVLTVYGADSLEYVNGLTELKVLHNDRYNNDGKLDYFPISQLKNLETLWINDGYVEPLSLSFLKPLKNIKKLTLNVENIDTLDGIQYLPNLETLFINPSLLEDISHIKNNTSLSTLRINDNLLVDVSAIGDLTNLTYLDLSYNEIEKIDSLSNLNKLKYLDISSNNIKDFSFLKEMKSLEILYMWNAGEITKEELAEIINALPNLEWIDCGTNEDGIANWVREEFPHINVGNKDLEESADAMYKANSEMMAETEN